VGLVIEALLVTILANGTVIEADELLAEIPLPDVRLLAVTLRASTVVAPVVSAAVTNPLATAIENLLPAPPVVSITNCEAGTVVPMPTLPLDITIRGV